MKKIILTAIVATGLLSAATQSGEELFKAKCAVCHKMGEPKQDPNAVAPMLIGVATHLQETFKTKEDRVKHIKEFAVNPKKEKAICDSVKRFGLMPSQKGNVSEEELAKIAEFMAEQKGMSDKMHKRMQKMEHRGKGRGMMRGKMGFKDMDMNGDGSISKEEFENFREKRMKEHKGKGMSQGMGIHQGQGKGMHQGMGMHKEHGKGCNK